jgi:hypothetical protein
VSTDSRLPRDGEGLAGVGELAEADLLAAQSAGLLEPGQLEGEEHALAELEVMGASFAWESWYAASGRSKISRSRV